MWRSLLLALLISVFSIGIGLALGTVSKTMGIMVHAKDLSQYGLTLVRSSDPDFDTIARASIKDLTKDELEFLRPLSIGLRNNGSKAVVAHTVIWAGTTADGATKLYNLIYANSEFFTDRAEFVRTVSGNLNLTIEPGKSLLLTLVTLRREGPAGGGGGSRDNQETSSAGQTAEYESLPTSTNALRSEIMRYADITVSIDGAFFEDGTFVGPDTLGFFDRLKGQVEAKRKLRTLISERLASKKGEAEIFKEIEGFANLDVKNPSGQVTVEEYNDYFTKFFAQLLLAKRKTFGGSPTLEKEVRSNRPPQPELTRILD